MSDSSTNAVNEVLNQEPNKPEQFYFAVEMNDKEPIVTICPVEFFDAKGYLDEQYYDEITEMLEANGFFAILESSYEHESEDATIESVTKKMMEMGFKQNPEFDQYIEETETDFNLYDSLPDSSGTYTSNDNDNDEETS